MDRKKIILIAVAIVLIASAVTFLIIERKPTEESVETEKELPVREPSEPIEVTPVE